MHISKRSVQTLITASALIGSFALAGTAFAAGMGPFGHAGPMPRPAIVGTVASISGNTLMVNIKNQRHATTTTATTYTVDATNATVIKGNVTSTVSAIAVGDQVMVKGTVNGTNVTATIIRDVVVGRSMEGISEQKAHMGIASGTPMQGDGKPVIGGKVTAITGTSLSITNSSNVTYTVDASSAKIVKLGVQGATLSNISVGDTVVVQGTINGTAIAATSVIDQAKPSVSGGEEEHRGFFGAIGGFFAHMFGF